MVLALLSVGLSFFFLFENFHPAWRITVYDYTVATVIVLPTLMNRAIAMIVTKRDDRPT